MREWADNPLWRLPPAWRPMAWDFWAYWGQALKDGGQLTIATRIVHWIDDGMTMGDLELAFKRLTSSDETAKHKWGGEVMAALAEQVAIAMRDRRIREKEARFKAESEAAKKGTAPRAEFSRLLESIGSMADG